MLRSLLQKPLTTFTVIATLGLGLGSLGVVAALIGSVLFPRLPYQQPERMVLLWAAIKPGATQPADHLTPARMEAWLAAPPRAFSDLAAFGSGAATLRLHQSTQRVTFAAVTPSFFSTLGITGVRGRVFGQRDSMSAGTPALVLSDRAWRRYFRADPAVIGQSIALNEIFYTVVGITPPEMNLPSGADLWVLRAHVPKTYQPVSWLMLARLRPHVTLEFARAEVIQRSQLDHQHDSTAFAGQGVTVVRADAQERQLGSSLLPIVGICLAALYLIAALNLAILFLLQTSSRARELAIRAALDAGVWRALRPLLAEIGLQFILGGALATVSAWAALHVIRTRFLFDQAPPIGRGELMVLAAVGALAVSTLAFMAPLMTRRARATDLFAALRRSGETSTPDARTHRLRQLLVGSEIALAIALACTAAVVSQALRHYRGVAVGYAAERVITARPDYAAVQYNHQRQLAVAEAVRAHLLAGRGVADASFWRRIGIPWPAPPYQQAFAVEGRDIGHRDRLYEHYEVGPRFLETIGAPILQGRSFDLRDQRGSLAVAIINRRAAEVWWPGESALGKRVTLNPTDPAAWLTIVGVADVVGLDPVFDRTIIAADRARPQLFRPLSQGGQTASPFWNWAADCFVCPRLAIGARASANVEPVRMVLQQAVRNAEPNLPLDGTRTMYEEQIMGGAGVYLQTNARTIGGFAAIAALLAMLAARGNRCVFHPLNAGVA